VEHAVTALGFACGPLPKQAQPTELSLGLTGLKLAAAALEAVVHQLTYRYRAFLPPLARLPSSTQEALPWQSLILHRLRGGWESSL
jgi:hypothetical protein